MFDSGNPAITIITGNPIYRKLFTHSVSKNPGIGTIRLICDALDITLADFFTSNYFNCIDFD